MNEVHDRLKVIVRIRPFLKEEARHKKKRQHYLAVGEDQKHLYVMTNTDDKEFKFDHILDMNSDQIKTFEHLGEEMLSDVLEGFNSTIIAYGQTGSGKTHSVFGSKHSVETIGKTGPMLEEIGLVPRLVEKLFEYIPDNPRKAQFRITVSFLQIYMEHITDLLAQDPYENGRGGSLTRSETGVKSLSIREDPKTGIFVHGLTLKRIKNKEELLNIIKRGARFRSTNSTTMNKTSSRSHAILQVFIEQRWDEIIDEGLNNDLMLKK